jgi:ATP-dependent Clp protease, protease subunit
MSTPQPPIPTPQGPGLPPEIYATLTGSIDADMVRRVFNAGSIAMNARVRKLHLLIHSNGGFVGDGITLYNYLRGLPIEITTYNMGTVMSIAVLVYLAGKVRNVSNAATFMIHKSTFTFSAPAAAELLKQTAEGLMIDDARSEAILREHVNMPLKKWRAHERWPLTLTAEESVQFGLAHAIADWAPPAGASVSTL